MLKEHPNHPVPRSDVLKVGDCLVDLPRREVVAVGTDTGTPRRITQKALQVLLMLAGHPGKVVGREALLEWVWPDTMPTDDVVTQAIAQLRRAFGDDHGAPRYIETIAKGGYRLLAPVAWIEPQIEPSSTDWTDHQTSARAQPPLRRKRRAMRMLAVALPAVLLLMAGAWALNHRLAQRDPPASNADAAPATPLDYTTITSRPGRETDPTLSPDGALVAYAEVFADSRIAAIMLQATAQVPPRQLSHPPPGSRDSLPTWSRDGRKIAFVRTDADGQCTIMVMPASGGEARNVGRCYGNIAWKFDWTPDGRGLLMSGVRTSGDPSSPLRMLDLTTGETHTLPYPIADGDVDLEPRYSPDGRWIVFRRNLSLSDLWKMPAGGGPLQRLTTLRGDIRGWDWMPDGQSLLLSFFSGSRDLYRYRMRDGRLEKLTDHGRIEWPDVAADGTSVVFQLDLSRSGLFEHALDDAGKAEPRRLFAASGSDLLPAVSPDGTQLAYISTRTLKNELWLGRIDDPDSPRPVAGIVPIARHAPVWSPAGDRLLVLAYGPQAPQLFEVNVDNGQLRQLQVPEGSPIYAAYADDPDRLLVGTDDGSGKLRLVLYDTAHRPWRPLAAIGNASFARYSPISGRIYFTITARPGLWSADARLAGATVINDAFPGLGEYKQWTLVDGVPHFLIAREGCGHYWTARPQASPSSPLQGRCVDPVRSPPGPPSASHDGRRLYLSVQFEDNADIALASLAVDDDDFAGAASAPPAGR